jgi:hypothetical protein
MSMSEKGGREPKRKGAIYEAGIKHMILLYPLLVFRSSAVTG